ncbi:MAG: TraB/GumN family protein [Candidatus Kapaibacterium sp.]
MKKSFILIVCFLFLINESRAGSGSAFFWSAESDSAKVYMLGSVHLADSSFYPLDLEIESAFNGSDVLVLELNLDKIDPFSILNKGMYSGDTTLSDVLSPGVYSKLAKRMTDLGLPEQAYKRMRPWFAVMTLQLAETKNIGYSSEYGIDLYFLKKSEKNEKVTDALETMEMQINAFMEMDAEPDKFVAYMLEDDANSTETVQKMMNYWKNGQRDKLAEYLDGIYNEDGRFKNFTDEILYKRNEKMADKIESFLNTGKTYFVIAGAAHFLGEGSIIDILEKKGYKITYPKD